MDPFIYQYLVGGIVFLIGTIYGIKQGYIGTQGRSLRNLILILVGLGFFAGVQGYLQYGSMKTNSSYEYPCAQADDYEACFSQLPSAQKPPVLVKKSPQERARTQEVAQSIEAKKQKRDTPKMGTNLDYGIMIAYFLAMLGIGTWFGRGQSSTKDFFFGGQRFSWWLISFSLVATTIGSYSFVKYSKVAYTYGIASSQTYMNDWFWIPLLLFGWLPILYFSRVVSIPEYFERRFGRTARRVSTILLLAYLIGYVGVNLFTMGKALNILLGWDIFYAAAGVASISAVYVTFGGQTSVIMTDLFQGFMLLLTGLILLFLGMEYLGGPMDFWNNLPRSHRMAFPDYDEELKIYGDTSYPAVGIFWQDAMANSAMFYFLNQGMVMRLMAAKSINDSRKAVISMLAILMPIAALVVASGGWVGKALSHAGVLPEMEASTAFFVSAEFLSTPGVFGLIMAALTAALMSTVDTLVTAVSAIVVNDLYKPLKPKATETELLKMARISAMSVSIIGILLVPIFMQFDSIYSAHGAFTAAVTPPLVVSLLLGVFWRRFTPFAAICTMIGGSLVIFASILYPEMITPFAHGVPMKEVEEGFLSGKGQYKFMRGFFGLFVCFTIGIATTFMSKARPIEEIKGLVWGTVKDAIAHYKGSYGEESESISLLVPAGKGGSDTLYGEGRLPAVCISNTLAQRLNAKEQDLIYVSDQRGWLGGLRSAHAIIERIDPDLEGEKITLCNQLHAQLVEGREDRPLRVQRLY
ncbi:MAG: sodium:solute symporter family protein [Myxococcota bacterium]|nr:sodium:solute symporter family protein [Myxococcota bacterium]